MANGVEIQEKHFPVNSFLAMIILFVPFSVMSLILIFLSVSKFNQMWSLKQQCGSDHNGEEALIY